MRKSRLSLLVFLTVFMCVITAAPVIAGQGNSSGGGQGQPVELVSSTPADGASGVALDTEIRLIFSKNVVNMQVKDINQDCFSMFADNTPVPVEVVMADDQIEPEFRDDVVLVPSEGLKPDTNYTIKVAPKLQSKSGSTLEKEHTISFITIVSEDSSAAADSSVDKATEDTTKQTVDKETEDEIKQEADKDTEDMSKQAADKDTEDITKQAADKDTEDMTKPAADKKNENSAQQPSDEGEKSSNSTTIGIIVAVIAAGGLLYAYIRRKK